MKPKFIDNAKERRREKVEFGVEIGKYLRKIRESKDISQENLSLKAGYYRTFVGKIEQGLYSPSAHTIWRLADALGLSLAEFYNKF